MATVKCHNFTFECTTAIKGADYIHLLDSEGVMVAAFDGVTDFSIFSIENGTWQSPTAEHDCYVAVIRDDGTIGKGSHRCSDIKSKLTDMSDVVVCDSMPDSFVEGQWYLVKAEV